MESYVASVPLQLRFSPTRVLSVQPREPFTVDEEAKAKIEQSVAFKQGLICKHSLLKKQAEGFRQLGIAVLLSSEQFGDVWLIPNEGARAQVGVESVATLPEELEILQAMPPETNECSPRQAAGYHRKRSKSLS